MEEGASALFFSLLPFNSIASCSSKLIFSSNPSYLKYGQPKIAISSSQVYQENDKKLIANVVSSSYMGHDADFKRQVYISRIAIFDEHKNLMGVATLANPVLKDEDEDYTFKLKIDI